MGGYYVDLILSPAAMRRLHATSRSKGRSVNGYVLAAVFTWVSGKGYPVEAPAATRGPRAEPGLEAPQKRTIRLPESYRGTLTAIMLKEGLAAQAVLRISVVAALAKDREAGLCRTPV
jgi:hypothetical protein